MKNLVIVLLLCILPNIAKSDTFIMYINGAFNSSFKTTKESADRFHEIIRDHGVYDNTNYRVSPITYWIPGAWTDVGEIKSQQWLSNDALERARNNGASRPLYLSNEYLIALGENYQTLIDLGIDVPNIPILFDPTINIQKETEALARRIALVIDSGHKLVIATHSQGNLYTEGALAYLHSKNGASYLRNVRVIGLGAVSASTYNNKYISLLQDKYVSGGYKLGLLFKGGEFDLLEANTLACVFPCTDIATTPAKLAEVTNDYFLHSAKDTYFNEKVLDSSTLQTLPHLIASYVKSAIEELNPPQNLLLGATVTDSCISCPTSTYGDPNSITDGNMDSARNLGTYSGSFNIFLSNPTTLSRLVLNPGMTPDGTVYWVHPNKGT